MAVAKALPTAKPIPTKPAAANAKAKADPEILDLEELPPDKPSGTFGLTPLGRGLVPLGPTKPGSPAPAGSFGGLTPLPTPGANPYGGGLTPLGPAPASAGGLVPLGPAPTAPSAPDPFAGLTPLSAYPAVSPPVPNPLGVAGSPFGPSANPYAAPALPSYGQPSYSQPAYQAPVVNDSHRKGLPWERDPSMESFNETMSVVLGSPQEAFSTMRRTGGVGNPIGFMIIGMVIGADCQWLYYGIIGNVITNAASERPFNMEALAISGVVHLVVRCCRGDVHCSNNDFRSRGHPPLAPGDGRRS